MNKQTHTDIKSDSTILGLFPEGLRPYAVLARVDRPIGIWLLLLPGLWSITLAMGGVQNLGFRGVFLFVMFFFGAVIMRGAGCVINDLWDRDIDSKVERTRQRPLASGELDSTHAIIFLFALLWLGLCILIMLPPLVIVLGFISFPLVVVYPFMKRVTWWPQAFLGVTFNFGALMGWAAVTNDLGLVAMLMYVSGIFWTLGYDTIYAHQDKDDDSLLGVRSTALYLKDRSPSWVSVFYVLSWVCLCSAVFVSSLSLLDVALLLPAGLHLALQVLRWNHKDSASSLKVFKSNQIYGVLVLAGIAASGLV